MTVRKGNPISTALKVIALALSDADESRAMLIIERLTQAGLSIIHRKGSAPICPYTGEPCDSGCDEDSACIVYQRTPGAHGAQNH